MTGGELRATSEAKDRTEAVNRGRANKEQPWHRRFEVRGQFWNIVDQLQIRCDTLVQKRQAAYIGAISSRRNDVLGFNSPLVAIHRLEPQNGSVAVGFRSFEVIARHQGDRVNASAQEPAPGGAEKALGEPMLYRLRKVMEYNRQIRKEPRLPSGPDRGYRPPNLLGEGA